jgi:hypothetical protein
MPKHIVVSSSLVKQASEAITQLAGGEHSVRGRAAGAGASAGAALGSMIGGPMGAVVGAALGGGVAVVVHESLRR